MKTPPRETPRLFLAIICPIISMTTVAVNSTLTGQYLDFDLSSNIAASGGGGPNQVSSLTGLALFLASYLIVNRYSKIGFRLFMVCIFAAIAIQCALTFSQSGLYLAMACILVSSFYLSRDIKSFVNVGIFAGVIAVAGFIYILSRIDELTGNALTGRLKKDQIVRQVLRHADRHRNLEQVRDLWHRARSLEILPQECPWPEKISAYRVYPAIVRTRILWIDRPGSTGTHGV